MTTSNTDGIADFMCHGWDLAIYIFLIFLAYQLVTAIYTAYLSPLSKFPGPKSWAASHVPLIWTLCTGQEHTVKHGLHQKYGSVVRISPTSLSFNTAQAWQDIYGYPKKSKEGVKRGDLPKDPSFYVPPPNGVRDIDTVLDDASHRRMRKLLSPAFSEKALRDQEGLLKRWAKLMVEKLEEKAGTGESVDLVRCYNFATFDIMGDLTFSEGPDMLRKDEYHPWVQLIFGSLKFLTMYTSFQMIPGLAWPISKAISILAGSTMREHFNFSADRVDQKLQQATERPDIWSFVLRKSDNDGGLTQAEMNSNAAVFMMAGTETSATLLSGLTYLLTKHPAVLEQLRQEIRAAFNSEAEITIDRLRGMSYLNACIEEAFRIYPPVPMGMPRITPKEGAWIDEQWVPGGVTVSVSQYATYHSPRNFVSPESFIPERWLGQDERFANDDKACLQPFHVGPRDCIGKNLAYHEIRLLMAGVLFHFELELDQRSLGWMNQEVYRLWKKPPLWVKVSKTMSPGNK